MSARQASIEVRDLTVHYGAVVAVRGVTFDVGAGEHLTLLGPSGCGKTTTLRAIAGLERPTSGEIRIGGSPVFSSAARVNVPAEDRGLSMVFQSYAIWPHMSVFDNVAYGLRVRKRPAAEVTARVREALDLVQLGDLGRRSAAKLSGGQQQRVALARAFVFSPSVLLFDEPLSNLDAKLRAEMRVELKELQRRLGITSVYVTHDLEEALAISDRVVVMRDGAIEQVGTPGEIYDRPRNTFVADFVGSANLIRGRRRPDLEQDGPWSSRRRAARSSTGPPSTAGAAPRRSWPSAPCASASRARRARIGQRVARPDPAARVPRRLHAVPFGLGRAAPHRALGGIGADGRGRGGLRQRRPPGLRAPRGVADPAGQAIWFRDGSKSPRCTTANGREHSRRVPG